MRADHSSSVMLSVAILLLARHVFFAICCAKNCCRSAISISIASASRICVGSKYCAATVDTSICDTCSNSALCVFSAKISSNVPSPCAINSALICIGAQISLNCARTANVLRRSSASKIPRLVSPYSNACAMAPTSEIVALRLGTISLLAMPVCTNQASETTRWLSIRSLPDRSIRRAVSVSLVNCVNEIWMVPFS